MPAPKRSDYNDAQEIAVWLVTLAETLRTAIKSGNGSGYAPLSEEHASRIAHDARFLADYLWPEGKR